MDIARRRRRRHGAASDDRISNLPDELLGCILQRVGSTRAAARTSVLSRRWRRVWAHLPDLQLGTCDADEDHPGATRLDTVDAALRAIDAAAPAAVRRRLDVAMHCHGLRVHPRRVVPWLRFASQHHVEEVSIEVPSQTRFVLAGSRVHTNEQEEDLELPVPVWGEATSIALTLDRRWRLRLPPAGLFVELIDLYICLATMEASELGHLVSSQCPRLRNLYLSVSLAGVSDVSIRSDSLQSLELCVKHARRFEVMSPKLEVLSMTDAIEARIYAPKLEEVTWDGDIAYDPRRHCFVDAGRHLRLLDLGTNGAAVASLMQRFDKTDVLKLNVNLNNTVRITGTH
nr:unnamed protein product [Digitaria exilis]